MTVAELIKKLKTLDQGAVVYTLATNGTVTEWGKDAIGPLPCWTIPPDNEYQRMLLAIGSQKDWDDLCKDGEPDDARAKLHKIGRVLHKRYAMPPDGVLL